MMSVFKREWQREDGSTAFCWYFHRTINGVRYRKALPTARTKTEAQEAERAELASIHKGTYGSARSMLLSDFIDRYYLPWARTNKRSVINDEAACKAIKRFFAKKSLGQVAPFLVEKFKRERKLTPVGEKKQRERAAASVNRELEILSKVFTMAEDNGMVASNPCRKVNKLRQDNRRTRYLTAEEERRLMSALTGRRAYLRPIVVLALNTGMRRGEILGLEWRNVDLTRGLIYVTNTKSGKDRVIPLNQAAQSALESVKQTGQRVFDVDWIKVAWMAALKDAKISDFRFHDLRHTAATRLADAGTDAFTIAAILGHSTIQMSARYTHATDERKRRALENMSRSQNPGHVPVTQLEAAS
jgi:integrase